eukprot:Selendium_serpulae@DN1915_c0_g1_i1.p3
MGKDAAAHETDSEVDVRDEQEWGDVPSDGARGLGNDVDDDDDDDEEEEEEEVKRRTRVDQTLPSRQIGLGRVSPRQTDGDDTESEGDELGGGRQEDAATDSDGRSRGQTNDDG